MSRQFRLLAVAMLCCIGGAAVSTESPRFYPDDPIARAPESQDASAAKKYEIELLYEMTRNLFVTARLTARDAKGETWFLEFDPRNSPEGATGAVAVATKLFWALGYNQVESFLTTFDPKLVTIDPKATVRRPSGAHTPFKWDDVKEILEQAARNHDGTYRVIAGRLIPGKILGDFLYQGTRPDDPNDLVPHEHRRELRGLHVFAAWTNLTALKASGASISTRSIRSSTLAPTRADG
jgi:hypothetical protein